MSEINWKHLALVTTIPVAVVVLVGFFPEVVLALLLLVLLGMFAFIVYFIYEFIGLYYGDDKD